MSQVVMELKGEMSMLNVLHLHSTDLSEICQQLEAKRDEVPAFFQNSPVIVDCTNVADVLSEVDLPALKQKLSDLSFVPVGIRGIEPEQQVMVTNAGWPTLRSAAKKKVKSEEGTDSIAQASDEPVKSDQPRQAPSKAEGNSTEVFEKPVRSGQQVYVDSGDAVLLTHTSAGSEVMAGGSIHVYGAIRGRVLAGVHGDVSARIFCKSLDAELIAIAGCYQLLDEGNTDLRGKPAMI
ncbi:MAG: septum site-determining protein MinC, partial [Leucothrix sp.]